MATRGSDMPQSRLSVKDVAASLHVSTREVVRMVERGILPAQRVRGAWQFRAAEIWNWISTNMQTLPARREKDRHPAVSADLLVAPILREAAIAVDLAAKTKSSTIRELAQLAAAADPSLDDRTLTETLLDRESQGSTALEDGVAIPHPSQPVYVAEPIVVAARTAQGIVFGERGGGLTDLFFLVCCPNHVDHLLYLGRLCRLLVSQDLRSELRSVEDASAFVRAVSKAETELCQSE